ncbi:MAG: ABC transporter ATP-binding protein [Thermotaleaceae bacterium]
MIELTHVTFSYGTEDESVSEMSVEDIDFSVKKGQCVVLCGRSGSGKSTILRLISGLAPGFYEGVLEGTLSVNGSRPSELTPEQKTQTFGVVFQDPRSQFFMEKVQDEIAFSAENIGLSPQKAIDAVEKIANLLEIKHLLERKVDELSSGQKQRIAIAAAVVLSPPVLVLDEPISNLDPQGIEILIELLQKIKNRGTTIIISEHRLHQFLPIADRYIHINHGKLLHNWSKDQFAKLTCEDLLKWGLRHPDLVKYKKAFRKNKSISEDSILSNSLEFHYKHSAEGIHNISFKMPRGSVTAIIGRNGTGKTTLCKILCGLLKQKDGTLSWNKTRLSPAKRRAIRYLVMQDADYQLYSDSVGNELLLGKKLTDKLKKQAFEALDIFRLTEIKNHHPASLSGGEKQRVTMAAAYCSPADLIVLDEPTSGMDGEGVLGIANWVDTLTDAGKIVVIITHDELLKKIACDRTIQMGEAVSVKSMRTADILEQSDKPDEQLENHGLTADAIVKASL